MRLSLPAIATLRRVPEFARGFVRDLRPRRAFGAVGRPYEVARSSIGYRPYEGERRWPTLKAPRSGMN